ncbi:diadenosine tetraphosphate (Ap4A) HIT family hydrolase [Clostridium beijerinckii]|nr:diadenosine tetraphosphate (Ap4A) HIT family hydrolase [Clostridium beijerinckii]
MEGCIFCKIISGDIPSKKYMRMIKFMLFMT